MNIKLFLDSFFRHFLIFSLFFAVFNFLLHQYNVPFELSKEYLLFFPALFSTFPLCGKQYWSQNKSINLPISKEKAVNALLITLASQGFKVEEIDINSSRIKAVSILKFSYFNSTEIIATFSVNDQKATRLDIALTTNSTVIGMGPLLSNLEKGLALITTIPHSR